MGNVFTNRMPLRRVVADDAGNLYDLDNDPEVMRFINGGVPTPIHVVQHELLPAFLRSIRPIPSLAFGWRTALRPKNSSAGSRCGRSKKLTWLNLAIDGCGERGAKD